MAATARAGASKSAGSLVALSANDCWNIVNYRSGLIAALRASGFRVVVLAPQGPHSDAIAGVGAEFVPVPMTARGTSPVDDLRTLAGYLRALRRLRPEAFLGFTAKPNIYGSLAAHALGIPVINNISGLGTVFGRESLLSRLVSSLYKAALGRSSTVFFQNRDDRALFERRGLVRPCQAETLPGSGVDLCRFKPAKVRSGRPLTFLFAARLLWDKGVGEFVSAARQIRARAPDLTFEILGFVERPSDAAVPAASLEQWDREGAVRFLGSTDDVREPFSRVDCVVLPSYYREGVPRVLLEAAAMALPVITTDAPGCRDAVDDGVTGLLCTPGSVESLVAAIERLIAMPAEDRRRMGAAARVKMEREFREDIVHAAYQDALAKVGISGR